MAPVGKGVAWFRAGAYGLLLFGLVHSLAVYKGLFVPPADSADQSIVAALLARRMDAGPLHSSAWHTLQLLNAGYSILLLHAGALNLVALPAALTSGRLRRLTLVNIAFAALMFLATLLAQFPPPMVFALAVLLLFVVSLLRQSAPGKPDTAQDDPSGVGRAAS